MRTESSLVTRTNTRNSVLNKDVDQIHRCCVTYQDFVAGEHAGGKGLQDAVEDQETRVAFPASAGYPFGNTSPLGSSSLHTIDILQGLGV